MADSEAPEAPRTASRPPKRRPPQRLPPGQRLRRRLIAARRRRAAGRPKEPGSDPEAKRKLTERERRLRRRAAPLAGLAAIAFIAGLVAGAGSAEEDVAKRYIEAWADQDFNAMHAELSPASQEEISPRELSEAYQQAQNTSTATAIAPGDTEGPLDLNGEDIVRAEVSVNTRLFGSVGGALLLPIQDGKISYQPHIVFPGLQPGQGLGRRLTLGERAPILARDGTPLAEGQGGNRSSPLGSSAIDVVGELGEPDATLAEQIESAGYPAEGETGVSGLERAFNSQLAGQPGGELLAVPAAEAADGPDVSDSSGGRVLGRATEKPGRPLRTTIDPDLQEITVGALGGQFGGVAVLDTRNGNVLALAGSAYSSPQPPGSTFKIVTTTAGLETGDVKLDEVFPVVTEINAGGRIMENAHDSPCGGDFITTFALSCNTVFGPLGVEVGEEKLVEVSERYGFNQAPTLFNEEAAEAIDLPESSIPTDPGEDVDLAASAIGQGRVLATPLQMASISQTVANGGVRSPTSIVRQPQLRSSQGPVRVTSRENARILRRLMEEVVSSGTGAAAAVPGITVAGKTGTAELGPDPNAPAPPPGEDPQQIENAWFTAFAPSNRPRIAVAVMLVDASADGGTVAAPIAGQIIAAAGL